MRFIRVIVAVIVVPASMGFVVPNTIRSFFKLDDGGLIGTTSPAADLDETVNDMKMRDTSEARDKLARRPSSQTRVSNMLVSSLSLRHNVLVTNNLMFDALLLQDTLAHVTVAVGKKLVTWASTVRAASSSKNLDTTASTDKAGRPIVPEGSFKTTIPSFLQPQTRSHNQGIIRSYAAPSADQPGSAKTSSANQSNGSAPGRKKVVLWASTTGDASSSYKFDGMDEPGGSPTNTIRGSTQVPTQKDGPSATRSCATPSPSGAQPASEKTSGPIQSNGAAQKTSASEGRDVFLWPFTMNAVSSSYKTELNASTAKAASPKSPERPSISTIPKSTQTQTGNENQDQTQSSATPFTAQSSAHHSIGAAPGRKKVVLWASTARAASSNYKFDAMAAPTAKTASPNVPGRASTSTTLRPTKVSSRRAGPDTTRSGATQFVGQSVSAKSRPTQSSASKGRNLFLWPFTKSAASSGYKFDVTAESPADKTDSPDIAGGSSSRKVPRSTQAQTKDESSDTATSGAAPSTDHPVSPKVPDSFVDVEYEEVQDQNDSSDTTGSGATPSVEPLVSDSFVDVEYEQVTQASTKKDSPSTSRSGATPSVEQPVSSKPSNPTQSNTTMDGESTSKPKKIFSKASAAAVVASSSFSPDEMPSTAKVVSPYLPRGSLKTAILEPTQQAQADKGSPGSTQSEGIGQEMHVVPKKPEVTERNDEKGYPPGTRVEVVGGVHKDKGYRGVVTRASSKMVYVRLDGKEREMRVYKNSVKVSIEAGVGQSSDAAPRASATISTASAMSSSSNLDEKALRAKLASSNVPGGLFKSAIPRSTQQAQAENGSPGSTQSEGTGQKMHVVPKKPEGTERNDEKGYPPGTRVEVVGGVHKDKGYRGVVTRASVKMVYVRLDGKEREVRVYKNSVKVSSQAQVGQPSDAVPTASATVSPISAVSNNSNLDAVESITKLASSNVPRGPFTSAIPRSTQQAQAESGISGTPSSSCTASPDEPMPAKMTDTMKSKDIVPIKAAPKKVVIDRLKTKVELARQWQEKLMRLWDVPKLRPALESISGPLTSDGMSADSYWSPLRASKPFPARATALYAAGSAQVDAAPISKKVMIDRLKVELELAREWQENQKRIPTAPVWSENANGAVAKTSQPRPIEETTSPSTAIIGSGGSKTNGVAVPDVASLPSKEKIEQVKAEVELAHNWQQTQKRNSEASAPVWSENVNGAVAKTSQPGLAGWTASPTAGLAGPNANGVTTPQAASIPAKEKIGPVQAEVELAREWQDNQKRNSVASGPVWSKNANGAVVKTSRPEPPEHTTSPDTVVGFGGQKANGLVTPQVASIPGKEKIEQVQAELELAREWQDNQKRNSVASAPVWSENVNGAVVETSQPRRPEHTASPTTVVGSGRQKANGVAAPQAASVPSEEEVKELLKAHLELVRSTTNGVADASSVPTKENIERLEAGLELARVWREINGGTP